MSEKSVLIGSCGGLTGVYLSKELRKFGKYKILGMDSDKNTIGKFFVDSIEYIPSAKDEEGFLDSLVDICKSNNVTYYLPTHSTEVRLVSRYAELLRDCLETRFLVSSYEAFSALDNKKIAHDNLRKIGVPVPHSYDLGHRPTLEDFPLFAKKDMGSGGSGGMLVENVDTFDTLLENNDGFSFFDYVEGPEYTVDCVFGDDGRLLGLNQRRRVKTIGGAVSITENDYSVDSTMWVKTIASRWLLRGCVNFQFIVDPDGLPRFTDINLRFPSGGLPLTVRSGIDVLQMMFAAMDGVIPKSFEAVINPRPGLRMYRYYDELFDTIE